MGSGFLLSYLNPFPLPYLRHMARFQTEYEFVYTVLTEFSQRLIEQRKRNVRKEKAISSRELLESYDYEITRSTLAQTASALIAFEEYGRFLDMKRVNRRSSMIPIADIEAWLLDGGLAKFRSLPADAQGRTAATHRKLLLDLAWGVSRNIQKRGRYKRKKRRKLQTGIESLLARLINELSEGYLDRTVEEIKESLTKSFA